MTNSGDDCYFYYYSTCAKGDRCPFRHCEAAMGSEVVCTLWQENSCFRKICKYRHMEIKKNRKEIPCYWENQPAGCQKPHCAFHHEKPRYTDGVCVPPSKGPALKTHVEDKMVPNEEPSPVSTPATNPANHQLMGVMKVETQENVPSPTHPPVVINPVDDEDEDEDDQFSEDDLSKGASPRKFVISASKDDSLNFKVRTLEEIRLRKALKAGLRKTGYLPSSGIPAQLNTSTTGEKENIRTFVQPSVYTARNAPTESGRPRLADRLGKRIFPKDDEMPMKSSLAQRLGGVVDCPEDPSQSSEQVARPVRARLGLPVEVNSTSQPSSACPNDPKLSGEIHIKTLQEIRQEKAAKAQAQISGTADEVSFTITSSSIQKGAKASVGPHVKTISKVLLAKKSQEENKKKMRVASSPDACAEQKVADSAAETAGVAKNGTPQSAGEVRVKTLEEIRKEKAARMQAKAEDSAADGKIPSPVGGDAPKRRILRIKKNTPTAETKASTPQAFPDKPNEPVSAETPTNGKVHLSEGVKVKTFEEIMREKRLRKQQQDESASASSSTATKPDVLDNPIHKPAARSQLTSPKKDTSTQRCITKRKTTSPVPEVTATVSSAESASVSSAKHSGFSDPPQPEKLSEAAPPKKSPEAKVKPKVNVKPSVMKPAAHVNPGQKRKMMGSQRSAVAAVKPLNAGSKALELPCYADEQPSKRAMKFIQSPDTSKCRPEESQMVPVLKEATPVPSSPSVSSSTATKARRSSTATVRTPSATSCSNVDDFDELMNEFDMEDEVELDPGKGEDDLLLELSEMIDG
ncbi:zinc finger CCCH domain-containing protein 11A [Denticeps clupeoides]|uniref:zinc finger CCCH domain-containing protein 11A n=1 Tax=Denticeps clupeoides TaxID=299321 RepID=UPI0010A2F3D0|nr:zinc finger CCCH domain-containing protein 11A [Denticeps clupeoides]